MRNAESLCFRLLLSTLGVLAACFQRWQPAMFVSTDAAALNSATAAVKDAINFVTKCHGSVHMH